MSLLRMKRLGEKICMVTCYDYPSGVHVDGANVDVALCGDSLGMVALGYETTQPVTLDEMIWDGEKQHFFYECPCGDVFTLTPDDVRAGEEIARCASCSLYIEVEYDSSQAEELLKELCV